MIYNQRLTTFNGLRTHVKIYWLGEYLILNMDKSKIFEHEYEVCWDILKLFKFFDGSDFQIVFVM